ncbi:MAG: hypothetical protein IJ021_09920 [Clostridia bacterium]|nr:hypothetical protein [Clostridia bacterium]
MKSETAFVILSSVMWFLLEKMIKIKNYIEIAAQKIYNNSCLASDGEKYNTNNAEIQQKIAYLSKFGVRYKNRQRDLAAVF